jgi:hypothetical protein
MQYKIRLTERKLIFKEGQKYSNISKVTTFSKSRIVLIDKSVGEFGKQDFSQCNTLSVV